LSAYLPTYLVTLPTCPSAYLPTYLPTCLPTYMASCLPACLPTYHLRSCLPAFIPFGLYKIFVYFESFVHEAIVLSFLPPTCIAHTVAIRLHDYWAI